MNYKPPEGDLRAIEEPEKKERSGIMKARMALQIEQDFDMAISLASVFLNSVDPLLASEAARLAALGMFRKRAYTEALPLFEQRANFSQQAADWYNAAAAATLSGATGLGEEYFSRALVCHDEADGLQAPSAEYLRFLFASLLRDCHEYQRSLRQLDVLRSLYAQYGGDSDTPSRHRFLPSLSQAVEVAIDVLEALKESVDADSWMKEFEENVDDEHKCFIADARKRLRRV